MATHPRAPLTGLFDNLDLSPTKPNPSRKLITTLRESIRVSGFPSWRTLRWSHEKKTRKCNFTLTMNEEYRGYSKTHDDPDVLFQRSAAIINELREALANTEDETFLDSYTRFISLSMSHVIFGSNMQEKAGLGLDFTIKICEAIFNGAVIDPADVEERSPEYEDAVRTLRLRGLENPDLDHVIRSRREVIQHAQAMKFIIDAALNRDKPLTEGLILETHRILCHGIAKEGEPANKPTNYEGKYRTTEAKAGSTMFTPARDVPREMARFIEGFNEDIQERETSGQMDPFYLAADVCQDFVTIHPFEDGNGRMCRLLLNAFLMKYAGIVVSIGEHDDDRKEYLAIAEEAGDGETEEQAKGKLATFVLEKAVGTLRGLREKLGFGGKKC